MKLDDFINERLEQLHMTRTVLVNNFGLSWSILSNIKHDKPISAATKEKLALALQCSQGDIQACLAELPDERRKRGSIMDAIDKVEAMLAAETVLKEAEREPVKTVADEPDDYGFAVQEECKEPIPMTVEEYRQRQKDLFLRIASNVSDPYDHMSTLTAAFGKAVLDMLVKGDQDVR